ncbi:hypothetical protein JCGZ_13974 [Jatropha curcas]|uniref:Uncharacterized protein n=1 Tax=Jatropha curcas TaxID=180498 RepID=A0A067JZM1_JATCU|nr:protein PHOSPHATE-INDUCED 1 [Jatropha curcas]KDP28203.1 hypothetical protein JCGZ_13974 [Jatropha curcas]
MLSNSLLCLLLVIVSALAITPELSNAATDQSQNDQASSPDSASNTITYHGGPLLTNKSGINVYILWYGEFSAEDRTTITDFFASFDNKEVKQEPSVSTWWKTIDSYKDKDKNPVSAIFKLTKQVDDAYSLGKSIKREGTSEIVIDQINKKTLPVDADGMYLVLTASDVTVDGFCRGSCGFHGTLQIDKAKIVYAHVGDASNQCPGLCAWPYALPDFGPPGQKPLMAPNGLGGDGLIMNIATVIAGAATNPYKNGYYQGDIKAPLEAVSACPGIFGAGAYPGNPGKLIVDEASNASFNAYGANNKKFLLPAIWDLNSNTCKAVNAAPA